MADIRCPMCGKPNPDHLDVCKFCQARLKPLIAPSSSDEFSLFPDQTDSDAELPDWLDLGNDFADNGDDQPFDDGDDWLTRLGGDPASKNQPEPRVEPSRAVGRMDFNDNNVPDWLGDFNSERSTPSFGAEEDQNSDQWLFNEDPKEETIESVPNLFFTDDQPDVADEPAPKFENDFPDWLKEFDEPIEPISFEAVDSAVEEDELPFGDSEDLPDWLRTENQASEPDVPISDTDQDQWISQLGKQETIPLQRAGLDEGSFSDWPNEEKTQKIESFDEGELPDWLTEMGESGDIEESAPAFAADEGELPDWLAGDEPESAAPAPAGDLPDWLTEMGESGDIEESAPAFAAEEGELPDWLVGDEPESAASTPTGDLPDWLTDMGESGDIDESTPAFAADEGEFPDWLADDEPESAASTPVGNLPDWLVGEEPASAAPAPASDLPDWLAGGEPESIVPVEDADMLGWLTDLDESTPLAEAASVADDEGLPDWLAEVGGAAAVASTASAMGDDEELPSWLSGSEDDFNHTEAEEADLPDWLAGMDGFAASAEEEAALPSQAAFVDDSRAVPAWLQGDDFSGFSGEEIPSETDTPAVPAAVSPFIPDDEFEDDLLALNPLSDWGAGEQISDRDQRSDADYAPGEADLTPAELPGWLAAMRPVEPDANGKVDRGPAETSGPLAGLYSTLAAEPDVFRLKQPPVYYSKLQVTEAQQEHTVLLQQLLETESKPQVLPLAPLISSHRIFKAVLGTILLVIAFLAVLGDTQMTALPEIIPAGVRQTSQLVDALSPDDTVLLAFDYEPGLAGEMDAAAAGVVDHMMLRGAKLALISTSPTGPMLAEHFISEVEGVHNYASGTQYVNMGYIPGGASGLASFARNPQWVVSSTLDGTRAWQTEPLRNIASLSDFAFVLVITDNPNTAQTWIEQVKPQLGAVPLAAVVSAQVEPMIQPYYDSQQAQLSGLVSGLTGGAAYEITSRSNLARDYWDAFNFVLIVAVSVILIGGSITLISDLLARRKESGGESA